jgi:signal peptidase II
MQAARGASLTEGATDATGEATAAQPRRVRRTLLLVAVAVLVIALDLLSKIIVVRTLEDSAPVKLLGGLFYLIHTRNTGAAFSLASGFTVVLTAIAVAVIAFILYLSRRLYSVGWAVALGMVLGGAAGNLVDRLFRAPGPLRGGVVDFIALLDPVHPPFPVFNLADSSLCIGVALAVLLELRGRSIDGRRRAPHGSGSGDVGDEPA